MNEIAIQDNPAIMPIGDTPHDIILSAQEQAQALMDVVEKQKMYQIIHGKKFPQVEAWQLLGAFTGLTAKVEWTKELDTETTVIRKARVAVFDREEREVSTGEAECRNDEDGKQNLSPNQILSTAQTRAESKAYRLKLSFIMKLAGYESTPAEEISENGFHVTETQTPTPKPAPPPKTTQAPEKVGKIVEPKPKLIGISKEEFQEVRQDCLRYVNEEMFKQVAEGLGFKGKKLSQMTQMEMADLIQACKNFQEEQHKDEEETETIKPFPVGEKEDEDAESEDAKDIPF